MDFRFIKPSTLTAIANAIRSKTGKSGKIDPANYASEINGIQVGITPTGTLEINKNGTWDITQYSQLVANIPQPQLYAPSLSLSSSALIITNKPSNGSYVEYYDLYDGNNAIATYDGSYTTIALSSLELSNGTHTFKVVAKGTGFVDSPSSNTVTYNTHFEFMIDNVIYTATYGMTWSEWVASSYNTDGYKVVDGVVTTADGTKEVYEDVIGTIYDEYGIEDNGLIYTLKAAKFSFTIGGKSYTATYGMTWGEWCESTYNTDGFVVTYDLELEYIYTADGTKRVEDQYVGAVTAEDEVVGEDYILVENMQTLSTPEIEIDGTTLNIYDEEGLATEYDILVDGVVKDTVEIPQGYTVDFSALTFNGRGDNCTLTIYDGQDANGIVVYQKTTSDTTFDQLTSYQFTSGYFYITWESGKASGFNDVTATGGATITSRSTSAADLTYATGTISGDGAISGLLTGDN